MERHRSRRGCDFNPCSSGGAATGSVLSVKSRSAIDRSGRLAFTYATQLFQDDSPTPTSTDHHFRFVDPATDTAVISDSAGGSLFRRFRPILHGYNIAAGDVPGECLGAPWPLISAWLQPDKNPSEAEPTQRINNCTWVLSSEDTTLTLEFDDDGWLNSAVKETGDRNSRGSSLRFEYHRAAGGDTPTSLRHIITEWNDGVATTVSNNVYTVVSFVLADQSPDPWFVLDQLALNTLEIDKRTGDVYAPNGDVLYNYDDLEKQLLGDLGGWLPGPTRAWQFGSVAVVLGIGLTLYRRRIANARA